MLDALAAGPHRFSELQKLVPNRELRRELQKLRTLHIIEQAQPGGTHALTRMGAHLAMTVAALRQWLPGSSGQRPPKAVLGLLVRRWVPLVFAEITESPTRPFEILPAMPREMVAATVISALRQLEAQGFVARAFVTPKTRPTPQYDLTRLGRRATKAIKVLLAFEHEYEAEIDALRRAGRARQGAISRVVGGKWVPLVLAALGDEPRRIFEVCRSLAPSPAPPIIRATLRRLEREGLARVTFVEAAVVKMATYALTPLGARLKGDVTRLLAWTVEHRDELRALGVPRPRST